MKLNKRLKQYYNKEWNSTKIPRKIKKSLTHSLCTRARRKATIGALENGTQLTACPMCGCTDYYDVRSYADYPDVDTVSSCRVCHIDVYAYYNGEYNDCFGRCGYDSVFPEYDPIKNARDIVLEFEAS